MRFFRFFLCCDFFASQKKSFWHHSQQWKKGMITNETKWNDDSLQLYIHRRVNFMGDKPMKTIDKFNFSSSFIHLNQDSHTNE